MRQSVDYESGTVGSRLKMVDNIRPTLDRENLKPSRDKIHDLFMDHVMAQAPGYKKLMNWTDVPIMPTPGAVGEIIQKIAKQDVLHKLHYFK